MSRSASPKPVTHLPQPPSLVKTIGPSFILLGLALGSGELIMWPYLASQYGLGLMWGALLGITFQYFLNTEAMRYTLAWGESVFVGWRKMTILIPLWFIMSTFIPWSLPGFSSASAQILVTLIPGLNETWVAIGLLLCVGSILTLGKTLYRTMELFQRTIILLGLPFFILLVYWFVKAEHWQELGWGLVGRGDGWWFFPPGVAITAFLGAFAFAGAGGNLNLAQSYYIKEKGFGMGAFATKITSLIKGGNHRVSIEGQLFSDTAGNRRLWDGWWRLINIEHGLVFWGLGFVSICLLAVLARALTFGQATHTGLAFLYEEGSVMSQAIHPVIGVVFLLVAAIMLFSTQLGVLESASRIISENVMLLFYRKGQKFNMSLAFYLALWGQIGLGIIVYLVGFQEPRMLLTLSAVLNAAAMMVAFPLLWWLNRRHLPKKYGATSLRQGILFIAFVCFLLFTLTTVKENL